ncbi:threonine/homoserine/homoserine lactone efflux protein [Orenia metallireducens]|jgi:threonine/homoserine/homoserine lactone efflux protein|uniref:Threonine/homoserine/homoserine lactone efflux protein n=1 Tax=Orenia metallireducens TaxID=1413210 RepID=A0A285HNY8_9FIRM|nr:LysE family translocator [Orenia metallireducens]PRX27996.1 threonine/homoserine/homoserine lactone efflux protein [Orenia metallireducens]SNY37374.1 Threonine/homoserine/homoserine lactone efflux protein [Orenia metallireducens]
MKLEFVLMFSTIVFIASIVPGPTTLLALNHGIKYGLKNVMVSAVGNLTGTLIQAILSLTGLGILVVQSEMIFNLVKYFGVLYLIYIGIRALFQRTDFILKEDNKSKEFDFSPKSLFVEAFFITLGNPNAIIFFTALFPQFIKIGESSLIKIFISLLILSIIAFSCMMIYGLFGEKITLILNNKRSAKVFNFIVGSIFIIMGVSLALN